MKRTSRSGKRRPGTQLLTLSKSSAAHFARVVAAYALPALQVFLVQNSLITASFLLDFLNILFYPI